MGFCVCVCVCVCVWLASFTEHIFKVHPHISTSFLFEAELQVYTTSCLYSHELLDIWGCFHLVAVVKNATVNVLYKYLCEHVFNFSGYVPKDGIDGSWGNSKFNFLRNCQTVLWVTVPFYTSTSSVWVPILLCPLQYLNVWSSSHSGWSGHLTVVLIYYSSNDWCCWVSFHLLIGSLYMFFGELSAWICCPYFNWVIWLSIVELLVFLYILHTRPLSDISIANVFSQLIGCLFIFLIVSLEVQRLGILVKFNLSILSLLFTF